MSGADAPDHKHGFVCLLLLLSALSGFALCVLKLCSWRPVGSGFKGTGLSFLFLKAALRPLGVLSLNEATPAFPISFRGGSFLTACCTYLPRPSGGRCRRRSEFSAWELSLLLIPVRISLPSCGQISSVTCIDPTQPFVGAVWSRRTFAHGNSEPTHEPTSIILFKKTRKLGPENLSRFRRSTRMETEPGSDP